MVLNLLLVSPLAYRAMRNSGFIQLPSERTLRDYTHYYELKTGFQDEVDEQLWQEISALRLPEHRNHFGILLDEMKINPLTGTARYIRGCLSSKIRCDLSE